MASRVGRSVSLPTPSGFPTQDIPALNKALLTEFNRVYARLVTAVMNDGTEYMEAPFPFQQVATADLPAAADWEGCVVWDTTAGTLKFSDGSAWAEIGAGGGTPYSPGPLVADIDALSDPNADRLLFWDDSTGQVDWLTPTSGIEVSGTDVRMTANQRTASLGFTLDGNGAVLPTGVIGDLEVPFACTITAVRLLADQTGSVAVDIWKDTYANFPPTDADSITASAVPAITTAQKAQDTTLTGWTTSLAAGDILRFNVDSVTSITRLTLQLTVVKT